MSINIVPKVGIGPIKLGMRRAEVRSVLASQPKAFLRNQFAESETDHFESLGIQVDYDDQDMCNIITALDIADPILYDKHPTQMSFTECTRWLLELDSDIKIESDGVISRKLGISTYTSLGPDDPVECIAVFLEGYYDE